MADTLERPRPKIIIKPFTFGTQNMTEGTVTRDLSRCKAGVLQEIPSKQVLHSGFAPAIDIWVPAKDKHQALFWDTNWIDMKSTGWTRFHRSGRAEGWPFGTPARGLIWGRGRLVERPDIKVVIFGLWFLNSWEPMRADHHTHARNQIVRHNSIPIVQNKIKDWQANDYWIIGGGDANSIKWAGHFRHGLKQPWDKGLDRVWYDNRFNMNWKREGAETGVGRDMKHGSRLVNLDAVA